MATYWVKSGTGGTDAGTSWTNAAESIPGLITAQAIAGGDIIYVHNTHSYAPTAAITWNLPETGTGLVQILCVDGGDPTGASLVDGTVGNMTTGAIESTNASSAFVINALATNSALYIHGMTIKSGAGGNSSGADISIGNGGYGDVTFESCTFHVHSTSSGAILQFGSRDSPYTGNITLNNCTFKYATTAAPTYLYGVYGKMNNCKIDTSGSSPTTLFSAGSMVNGTWEISNCDFSAATNIISVAARVGKVTFNNCVIGTPTTGTHSGYGGTVVEFQACAAVDAGNGADILSYYYQDASGTVEDDQTIYLTTGGAQGEQDDGTDTSYSLKMTPSALCNVAAPLYTPWIYTLVGSTGDKTITMKVADSENDADELHTSQLWMEVDYMGEPGATGTTRVANAPHAQREVDDDCPAVVTLSRDVTAVGADRTDTDEAWTGVAETNTYTLTASINCAEVGYIRCRVGLAIGTTNPVYVDPKINVA